MVQNELRDFTIKNEIEDDTYHSYSEEKKIHAYRSNVEEAYESAKALNERGLAVYSVSYHNDPEEMQNPDFPPTFFCVGGDDGIWNWVMGSFNKEQEMGITSELHTFAGVPHAFGADTHADGTYYENAATWPLLADDFMQDLYAKNAAVETAE